MNKPRVVFGDVTVKKITTTIAAISVSLVVVCATSASLTSASYSAQASPSSQSSPLSALPKSKISQEFSANRLNVSAVKVKKPAKVSYQWIRNGVDLPGETSKSYEWQFPDCPQNVQVRVLVQAKGKKQTSSVSESFNPEACHFSTGELPAWSVLHNCGSQGDQARRCSEWTYSGPGGFQGYVYKSEKNQSWFRVPIPGIDPSRIISWRASAKGIGRSWALSLVMISKNEPSWACCDWKGTKFPPEGSLVSQVSDEVMGLPSDGGAYVGFDYYDKFRLSELFTLDSLEILVKYK